jgi:hypothetical protein
MLLLNDKGHFHGMTENELGITKSYISAGPALYD